MGWGLFNAEKKELETSSILAQISHIIISDIRNLFHSDGSVKKSNELDANTPTAIVSFKIGADGASLGANQQKALKLNLDSQHRPEPSPACGDVSTAQKWVDKQSCDQRPFGRTDTCNQLHEWVVAKIESYATIRQPQ